MVPAMTLALDANFGSVQGWKESFTSMATRPGDGMSQMRLSFQPQTGALVNERAGNDTDNPARNTPIVVMDPLKTRTPSSQRSTGTTPTSATSTPFTAPARASARPTKTLLPRWCWMCDGQVSSPRRRR